MTTCPSGVHYMHLVDHARDHIERTYRRPFGDRMLRALLVKVLPDPKRFRLALMAGFLAKPFRPLLRLAGLKRIGAMLALAPARFPRRPSPVPNSLSGGMAATRASRAAVRLRR